MLSTEAGYNVSCLSSAFQMNWCRHSMGLNVRTGRFCCNTHPIWTLQSSVLTDMRRFGLVTKECWDIQAHFHVRIWTQINSCWEIRCSWMLFLKVFNQERRVRSEAREWPFENIKNLSKDLISIMVILSCIPRLLFDVRGAISRRRGRVGCFE